MAKIKVTDERVRKALELRYLLSTPKEEWLFDTDVEGFAVRLSKSGKAFALYQYWQGGKGGAPRKLSLGEIGKAEDGKLTVVAARTLATSAKGKVADGGDPWADRKLKRDRMKAETFADAWGLFTASWSDENRFRRETKALVKNDAMPDLGSRPLVTINRRHITPLIDAVKVRSAARAHALFAALRLCFGWCVDSGLLEHSPMERMKPPKPPEARERCLSEKEVAAFWRASGQLGDLWRPSFRLLLLTAARREEVAAMEWRELDGDVWTVPGGRVKNSRKHIIDLPPLAVEIINSVPKVHDLVFTTTGTTGVSGWGKPKRRLEALMKADIGEFEPFTLHDLRRTIPTTLSEKFDYTDELGDRLLNHKKKGITKVYNKATLREKRKEALLEWSKYILELERKGK